MFIIMFFLESETIPNSLSFCCVIALEYSLSFQTYQGSQTYTQFPFKQKKQNFHCWCLDGHLYQLPVWKRMVYDGINEEVSVDPSAIDPLAYLHWPAFDVKYWVSVNHTLDYKCQHFWPPLYLPKKWIEKYTETVPSTFLNKIT